MYIESRDEKKGFPFPPAKILKFNQKSNFLQPKKIPAKAKPKAVALALHTNNNNRSINN